MKKRVLSIFLCLSVLLSLLTLASCSDKNDPPADKVESIAILYENDVHCAVDGYSKLAAMSPSTIFSRCSRITIKW